MEIKNFEKAKGKFLLNINREIQNINFLSITSKHWQGTESQLPASLENLVTNNKFLVASATTWSQFQTLQSGVIAFPLSVISETACHLVVWEKMLLSHFRLDKKLMSLWVWHKCLWSTIWNLQQIYMVPGKN